MYAATLERTLSEQLGVSWLEPPARTPMREMAGVPDAVRDQFSTRRADVVATYSDLEDEWFAVHGRSPTHDEAARMRDQATIRSRNPKSGGDVDLHDQWRAMIRPADQVAIDRFVRGTNAADGGRLEPGSRELRRACLANCTASGPGGRVHTQLPKVSRWIAQPTPESIEIEVERFIGECIALKPDDDPTYANVDEAKYTSATIQRAEEFVIDSVFERAPFRVDPELDDILGSDQAAAVVQLTRGSSRVSAVIGPAGAGKTTMLKSAASSYERAGRTITVLCLSAVAARNVTQETGLEAETIASWKVGNIELPEGGLVIVDEASMVPTLTLADLCQATRQAGSRVALVGDYAQMGAPEAGGLLRDIAATPAACELTSVRRFRNRWEAEASVRLRRRDPSIATTYERQGRLSATTTDRAHEVVADAWILDETAGRRSIVVVDTNTDAAAVSAVCQQRLRSAGVIGGDVVGRGADQNPIHVGDRIQTRRNTSELTTSDGKRVLNRDVWRVTGSLSDGSLTAVHSARKSKVVITPEYLDRYVVLAYATTIAGAQGRTVDQGHVLVTPRTTAESLYVGMTRGRESNVAHVICDRHDHDELDLGRRTPSQAFAAAVARTSKSGWSASIDRAPMGSRPCIAKAGAEGRSSDGCRHDLA